MKINKKMSPTQTMVCLVKTTMKVLHSYKIFNINDKARIPDSWIMNKRLMKNICDVKKAI